MVDLFVGVDLDGGAQRDGWQTSLQLGAYHQVVVFVDSFKVLLDDETFVTWMEDDLSLSGKHTACTEV